MKRTFTIFGVIALIVMVGFTFASCEGPQGLEGPQGPPGEPAIPELVFELGVNTSISLFPGESFELTPTVYPEGAIVQTLLWGLYDVASGDVISLRRLIPNARSAAFVGGAAVITANYGGEAKVVVTALGGDTAIQSVITVTVESVAEQIFALRRMDPLPASFEITTVVPDEPIRPQLLCFGLEGDQEIEITLTRRASGNGVFYEDTLYLARPGAMFTVGRGVTLVLGDVALQGMEANTGGALVVVDGGILKMNAGAVIAGNENLAGGVAGFGGGVRVNTGTFAMYGGEVSGNEAYRGGGVHINTDAAFTMRGGTIYDNFANTLGDTVIGAGGGVQNQGIFHMHGGVISGNRTRNIGHGGGVFNQGAFYMHSGAIIYGNHAHHGAGVRVNPGATFTMNAGARIHGNNSSSLSPLYGGGAGVDNRGIFRMYGGEIFGNIAPGSGGGVRVDSLPAAAPPAFYMHGGEIFGNTGSSGAGIENWAGIFRISGGVIYGNEATVPEARRNNAANGLAALNLGGAFITQYGSFIDGNFNPEGSFFHSNLTIRVENGVLRRPVQEGTLMAQLEWIRAFAQSGRVYIVELDGDQAITPTTGNTGIGITLPTAGSRTDLTVVLRSIGGRSTIRLSDDGNGNLFRIQEGVTIVLDGSITLEGHATNNIHLVQINTGGTLHMNDGSVITGNTTSVITIASQGGGVRVNTGGVFILDGGEISNNSTAGAGGGGVHVAAGGRFDMLDGEISNNSTAGAGGGGVHVAGGRFDMLDGEISGNTSTAVTSAGGVFLATGTVASPTVFNMFDGTISGNRATVATAAAAVTNATAGGVRVFGNANSIFNMRGGRISDNSSATIGAGGTNAGGVLVLANGLFRMSNGTIHGYDADIGYENTAANGWDVLFRATPATGALRGTFTNGVFNLPGVDLGNSNDTIEVLGGELVGP